MKTREAPREKGSWRRKCEKCGGTGHGPRPIYLAASVPSPPCRWCVGSGRESRSAEWVGRRVMLLYAIERRDGLVLEAGQRFVISHTWRGRFSLDLDEPATQVVEEGAACGFVCSGGKKHVHGKTVISGVHLGDFEPL